MQRKTSNLFPIIVIFLLIGIVAVSAASYFAFNNNGSVSTINVNGFIDEDSTIPLIDLNWEPILPGENDTRLIYVNSTSTIPAVLNLTTADWSSPNAEANVTLTWNREATVIQPNTIINATLTLTIAEDVEDLATFTFTAVIKAEEP